MNTNEDEKSFYICCPACKSILIQAKNGLDGTIKCGRCGAHIKTLIKDDTITVKQSSTEDK